MSSPQRLVVDLYASAYQWSLPDYGPAEIRGKAPTGWIVDIVSAPTVSDGDGGLPPSEEALSAIEDADAYFGYGISRSLFQAAKRLKWVHSSAAGVGGLLFEEMLRSDVIVTNSAGIHAIPIAEYVVGGILYLLRAFDIAVGLQQSRTWDKEPFVGAESPMREIADCEVVIVGAGGLGSAVAQRLSALGARCTGVRRHPHKGAPPGFSGVRGVDGLPELLANCNVLILTAPATPETQGIVTAEMLDRLSQGGIVVNVSRGSLLDDRALATRISSGRLRGAVLDVFSKEPLPRESPLWELSNVLITPHVSGVSPRGFWRRELDLFFDNWHRYASGKPLRNVVDKTAGY